MMSQSIDPSLNISMNQSLNDNLSIASSAFDQLKSERLGVPNKLIIDGFFYCFKDSLRNNRFSYRCRKRTCGVLLTIDKSELDKLKYGGSTEIYYCVSKEHNCIEPETKSEDQESILTERDLYNKGKSSILMTVDKPLSWHVKNLNELGIPMTTEQIKNILRYEREKKFPYDTQYLYNLNNITITLDCVNIGMVASDDTILAKNLPFCYNINKVLNPEKGNREERYIVFTSLPQIKHFCNSTELYIDCNYKIAPKGYYQILTIMAYNPELKLIVPDFIIPMSHKSKNIYSYIFNTVVSILYDNNMKFNDKGVKIYCEFEYTMRKELKKIFPNCELRGTYYHYIKRLWVKAKKMGLCTKNFMEYTHQVVFALEMVPFLKTEDMKPFFEEIKEYINGLSETFVPNFKRYIKYYEDVWGKTNFIHFDQISASEWNRRGNNNCEIYQYKLSNSIEYFFPKMASFVKRIKDLIKDYTIGSGAADENQSFNTYEAVYLFILDYQEKYEKKINFKALNELEDEFEQRMKKINIDNMKAFFGLQCISGMENEDDLNLNEYNYNEIEQILIYKEEKTEEKISTKNHVEFIDTGVDEDKNEKKTFSSINKFDELYAFEKNNKVDTNDVKDIKNAKDIAEMKDTNDENDMKD